MMSSKVYIVHCVDTEGPLYESLTATFERIRHIFHLDLKPERHTLEKLQRGELNLGGKEDAVKKVLDPALLAYNDTWDKIDTMLREALSKDYRESILDSAGNGWVYNWFCVDHVDYEVNPRRRDIGYHSVFDHYTAALEESESKQDGIHFHFHPKPFKKQANLCATHWWATSDTLLQVLSRRIIDRQWFPSVNRPGFHTTRPDSHWFLEQFIPFDMANQAIDLSDEETGQFDISSGRYGDWRRAPKSWSPYHPAHDDYQLQGSCRRWIARCLNIGTRLRNINASEVVNAFREAQEGKPVVLAFTNHDFRDIRPDVDSFRATLKDATEVYPDVEFLFCDAAHAMRSALLLPDTPPCDLDLEVREIDSGVHLLEVSTTEPSFGPQPFLALKTKAGQYFHDNFDFQVPMHRWTYILDEDTYPLEAVEKIGIATNNKVGIATIVTFDANTKKTQKRIITR